MSFTMKDAYSIMLREYPDVMNIEQMSQALGGKHQNGLRSAEKRQSCLLEGRTRLSDSQGASADLHEGYGAGEVREN